MNPDSKLHFTEEEQNENPGVEAAEQARGVLRAPRSSSASHQRQKNAVKRGYAEKKRETQRASGSRSAGQEARRRHKGQNKRREGYFARHRKTLLLLAALFLLVALLGSILSSCVALMQGSGSPIVATTYPSKDEDMLGAEAAYAAMEAELQEYLDTYEVTHSYDEYHYDLDEIRHDPYVLISLLTAYFKGPWTLAEATPVLESLFAQQYTLTEEAIVETRYDSDGEPYPYTICYVTLRNFDLSHLPVYVLSEDQLAMYACYMRTLGNRPDLFPGSGYVGRYGRPNDYHVPAEALADERFAAMLEEAEKYLGYPYVWGGSSPATSFDCSGFVSWVINHSGWNVGRLGAQSLYNICTPTSAPKPGDLVFFTGTFAANTPVSHVGIYVGNGMMIHCGDPIQYANLNTSYWQAHLYGYGRLP